MGKGCTKGSAASPEAASEGAWIGSRCPYGPASQGAPCSRRTGTCEGATAPSASEATQIKGDSETHPFLSPNDEFAEFGVAGWELGNLPLTREATPDMYAGSYVRSALLRG